MQDVSSTSTLRENLVTLLATFLSGGAISILIKWIAERRKTSAEVLEIHATAAKIEVEAREASTRTIMAAQARIVELVDINAELQNELAEACRQRDNMEYQLGMASFQLGQLKIEMNLDKQFIEQLQSANRLGVKLSDLPPSKKQDP